jgi:hypothetical protein
MNSLRTTVPDRVSLIHLVEKGVALSSLNHLEREGQDIIGKDTSTKYVSTVGKKAYLKHIFYVKENCYTAPCNTIDIMKL